MENVRGPEMTAQEGLVVEPTFSAPTAEMLNSPAWWQARSSDELQAIVHRGIQAGDAFVAAAKEMERRAAEQRRREDEEQNALVIHEKHLKWVLPALALVCAGVLLFFLLA